MDYPKSVPSVGLVNGKFVNEDVVAGLPGSLIPATWGNDVTDELLNVVKSAGLEPSETDATQLLQAVKKLSQAGEDKHAADVGAANLYIANYVPAITTLKDGLVLRFTAGNANTGASTFAPNGLLPKPLVSLAMSTLRPAEIVGGSLCSVVYCAALDSWLLVYASGGNATDGRLLGVRTFTSSGIYVPSVGMKNVLVKMVGGGGGSAGIGTTTTNQASLTGGSASGSYAEALLPSATIGASQVITRGWRSGWACCGECRMGWHQFFRFIGFCSRRLWFALDRQYHIPRSGLVRGRFPKHAIHGRKHPQQCGSSR